jgi:glyoxylase-like metal-dependent hydrolase (beta-lactamase superfamily II)
MSKWRYTKGLKDIGNGVWAYLQPDGSWGWSNAGLIVDGDRTLLVDTLFDLKLTAEMLADMRRSVPAASHVDTLFNTHHNGDHTFGNQLVEGAEIIATAATYDEMDPSHPALYHSMMVNAHKFGRGAEFLAELFKPFDFSNIKLKKPDRTFSGELDLEVGDKTVKLIELGPAHARGDTVALVPEDRVVFTGDLLFHHGTPIAWAGPVSNWVRACDRILAMDVDVIVPGHGPIADKQAVRDMKAYLEFVQDEARRRFKKGMNAHDAAFDIPLGRYADWGDAERIVVTVLNLYEEFLGEHKEPDIVMLFEQMADYRDKLRAEKHGHAHQHHHNHGE